MASVVTNLDGDETEYIDFTISTTGSGSDSVQYKIRAKDSTAKHSVFSEPYKINYSADPWKIAGDREQPFVFALFQNHPNPFNPATNIVFELAEPRLTTIKIYDILGQDVATLLNEQRPAGRYSVLFDASSLASGVYIYRLTAGSFVSTRKLMLMK